MNHILIKTRYKSLQFEVLQWILHLILKQLSYLKHKDFRILSLTLAVPPWILKQGGLVESRSPNIWKLKEWIFFENFWHFFFYIFYIYFILKDFWICFIVTKGTNLSYWVNNWKTKMAENKQKTA